MKKVGTSVRKNFSEHSGLVVILITLIVLQVGFTDASGALGYRKFYEPDAIVVNGPHIWIANVSGNSITEIKASNGSFVREVTSSSDRLNSPDAMAMSGSDLWVANLSGESATDLNSSNGALIHVIDSQTDELGKSLSIAVGDGHVWITNLRDNSVTELNLDGSLVRVLTNGLDGPAGIAVSGNHVWVTNDTNDTVAVFDAPSGALHTVINLKTPVPFGPNVLAISGDRAWIGCFNSVIELSTRTDRVVYRIHARLNDFNAIEAISVGDGRVWIANFTGNTVTELNGSSGAVVRVIPKSVGHFDGPGGIAVAGSDIWITNLLSNSITEIDSVSGKLIRTVK